MRKTLMDLGIDSTSLVIRDKKGDETIRYKNQDLRKVMTLLEQIEDYGTSPSAAACRCTASWSYGSRRKKLQRIAPPGRPRNAILRREDYEEFVERNKIDEIEAAAKAVDTDSGGNETNGNGEYAAENAKALKLRKTELAETKRRRAAWKKTKNSTRCESFEELIGRLAELDLPIEDWFLRVEETDSGEKKDPLPRRKRRGLQTRHRRPRRHRPDHPRGRQAGHRGQTLQGPR